MADEFDNIRLNDLSFAVYDVRSSDVGRFDPASETVVTYHDSLREGKAEYAVSELYNHLGYRVRDINHKENHALKRALGIEGVMPRWAREKEELTEVMELMKDLIIQHTDVNSSAEALDLVDTAGIPDLLIQNQSILQEFSFVEVKKESEQLQSSQAKWIEQFNFLPVKIAVVFRTQSRREDFIRKNSAEDLLQKANTRNTEERPELPSDEIANRLANVQEGDQILFNERKKPLTVIDTQVVSSGSGPDITGIKVISSQGNTYVLSENGDMYRSGYRFRRNLWWVEVLD